MFDFPSSPAAGQIYQPAGGPVFQFDGTAWRLPASAAPIVTPFVAYTPTVQGFGTITNVSMFSRRVGDCLHVKGRFQGGVATAVEARVGLGYNGVADNVYADPVKCTLNQNAGNILVYFGGAIAPNAIAIGGANYLNLGWQSATQYGFTPQNGNAFGNSCYIGIDAWIPINGWSAASPGVVPAEREQTFNWANSVSLDIPIPTGAKAVHIEGNVFTPASVTYLIMRLSSDGTNFHIGASDYLSAGPVHWSGSAGYAAQSPVSNSYAYINMGHDNVQVPMTFTLDMNVGRVAGSSDIYAFKSNVRSLYSPANNGHGTAWMGGYLNIVGLPDQLKIIRLMLANSVVARSGTVNVKWTY